MRLIPTSYGPINLFEKTDNRSTSGVPQHKQRESAYMRFVIGNILMTLGLLFFMIINLTAVRYVCYIGVGCHLFLMCWGLWWALGCYINKNRIPAALSTVSLVRKSALWETALMIAADLCIVGYFIFTAASEGPQSLGLVIVSLFMFILPIGSLRLTAWGLALSAWAIFKSSENSLQHITQNPSGPIGHLQHHP